MDLLGFREKHTLQGVGHCQGQGLGTRNLAERSYPMPEVRGGSRKEQPHVQRVAAVGVQEGREELLHVQGQEGRP